MKYRSVFDIIGPVMIGPSSSHTAGAARIGRVARQLLGKQPRWTKVHLYGSFADTYRGHGTDLAIVGGLLGFETYDERIIDALNIAKDVGMDVEFIVEREVPEHPNTAKLVVGDDETEAEVVGVSIGGGKIEIEEINGFKIKLTGEHPAIIIINNDRFGCIASVANVLAKHKINIGFMQVSRKEKGKQALMVLELDEPVDDPVLNEILEMPNILQVAKINE